MESVKQFKKEGNFWNKKHPKNQKKKPQKNNNFNSLSKKVKEKNIDIRYTYADVLTQKKLKVKKNINSMHLPRKIAITELNPKYYTVKLSEVEYKLTGYSLKHENLKVKDSTWGIAICIRETLFYKRIDRNSSTTGNHAFPKEMYHLLLIRKIEKT